MARNRKEARTEAGTTAGRSTPWSVVVYHSPNGACPFEKFLDSLDDYQARVIQVAVQTVLAQRGNDVCNTEWGKALGRGLYEFRIRRQLSTLYNLAGLPVPEEVGDRPCLFRVFFAVEGDRIVLLLSGYDKLADSSLKRQDKEIGLARRLLAEHKRHPNG